MRFFIIIYTLCAIFLILANPFGAAPLKTRPDLPNLVKNQQLDFSDSFKQPQYAHLAWAMMTGEKKVISPRNLKVFKDLGLLLLFSPSGIHFSAVAGMALYSLKKYCPKKFSILFQLIVLILGFLLPFSGVKRIIILRILILIKYLTKKNISIDILFCITFLISYFLGHFQESPLGFLYSFIFMGTFISLREEPRYILILGLLAVELLLTFFSGAQFSYLAILLNFPIISLFSIILPLTYLYLGIFHYIHYNWIEFILKIFMICIHWEEKLAHGTFIYSSVFLIISTWAILLKKPKKILLILFLLNASTIDSPDFFSSGAAPTPNLHRSNV